MQSNDCKDQLKIQMVANLLKKRFEHKEKKVKNLLKEKIKPKKKKCKLNITV